MSYSIILYIGIAISLFLGILFSYFGTKIFNKILPLAAFVIFGYFVSFFFFSMGQIPVLIAFAIGGIVGALFAEPLFNVIIFLLGSVTVIYTLLYFGFYSDNPWLSFIFAIIGGIVALLLQKIIILVGTAALGSVLVVGSVITIFTGNFPYSGIDNPLMLNNFKMDFQNLTQNATNLRNSFSDYFDKITEETKNLNFLGEQTSWIILIVLLAIFITGLTVQIRSIVKSKNKNRKNKASGDFSSRNPFDNSENTRYYNNISEPKYQNENFGDKRE
ncbi:MAG: hypothetical protein PWQ77_1779 [Kosmotogales bacterium]|nr:hypothetical protein [Kosmotogales bacterium]